MKPAAKTYARSFGLSMVAYVAAILVINNVPGIDEMPLWQAGFIALLPIVPITFAIKAELAYVRSWDELHKQMVLEGVVIGFLIVGLGTFSYGFLENVGFPKLDTIWIFPLLIFAQAFGRLVAMRKYR